MKSRLLSRKSPSRESQLVSIFSLRRRSQPRKSSVNEMAKVTPMKMKKSGPTALWAKACTEESTPERVRKVPKMTSA